MLFYSVVIGIVAAIGIVLRLIPLNRRISKAVYCIVSFLILGSLSAFRYDVGIDYSYIYAPLYEPILADPLGPFSQSTHEPGFVLLEKAIALVSSNYQALFIVTSFLIVGLFMLYYYRYSPSPLVSIFLFLTLSQYYCSMNFIRQTLAGIIALFALPFQQRRQFWRYLLIVLIASTFHLSALLLIPFYFINLIPVTKYSILIYIPVTIIIYLNSSGVLTFVTQYAYQYYDVDSPHLVLGFPIGFFLISLVTLAFLLVNQKVLTRGNPRNYIYINYAFFALFFIFLGTKHSILDRFSLYFELAIPVGVAIVLSERLKALPKLSVLRQEGLGGPVKRQLAGIVLCGAIVFFGAIGSHTYALRRDFHGVTPYQLIFDQPFYSEYVRSLGDG